MKLNVSLLSVQSARPAYPYGQIASIPLQANAANGLARVSIPGDVPSNAVVTKADIVLYARDDYTGSRTFAAQRNLTSDRGSKSTWNNRPDVTGTSHPVTVGAVAKRTQIRIDVAADVQLFVSGAAVNYGWRIFSGESTARRVFGSAADRFRPYLDLEYEVPATKPTDLSPNGGAVSVAKPTLTFAVPEGTTAIRVLIDPAADAVSPDWDSGEVPSTVGLLALSGTTFPSLALDASTSWAAFAKGPLGWSAMSDWATFSRVAKRVVTITAPGPTTGDTSPTIAWTSTGPGAPSSWLAELRDGVTNALIAKSGWVSSDSQEWSPPKGLARAGQKGRAVVHEVDDVDRVATPGDPIEATDTHDFTVVALGAAPGVEALTGSQVDHSPAVRLQWVGVTGDAWRITRDGEWLDLVEGAEREYVDYTAKPNRRHVYQVLPATDAGEVSPNGPMFTITPTIAGAWLMDPEDGTRAFLLTREVPTVDMAEQAVTHDVVGSGPVRRRVGVLPPSGTISGELHDVWDYLAADSLAVLYDYKQRDAGYVYRLAFANWNIPVTIGDLTISPTGLSGSDGRVEAASFTWQQTADELPWEG